MHSRFFIISTAFALSLFTPLFAADPLILFIAGAKSHGSGEHDHPAGSKLLAENLANEIPNLKTQISDGWPADESLIEAAASIVIYSDGGNSHPAKGHIAALQKHQQAGKGLAVFHYALEPDGKELGDFLTQAIGGYFDPAWSVNPRWEFKNPIIAEHPATAGVTPWDMDEEIYYHIRLRPDITPLLRALPPVSSLGASDGPRSGNPAVRKALADGVAQTIAWLVENENGSRGFGFTAGHSHHYWDIPSLRTLIMNSILWTAKLPIPEGGVKTVITKKTTQWPDIDTAIAKGDLDDVKLHIELNPERLQSGAKERSQPPLAQAILRQKDDIALWLVENGAEPNVVGPAGRTPLHLCIIRNNPTLISALLKAGAKPNVLDQSGWTPLHHAAAKNQLESAKALIVGGADASTLSKLGGTALHEAAASADAELIRYLLDQGIDPTIRSKEGVTALDLAKKYKNEAAIKILSEKK